MLSIQLFGPPQISLDGAAVKLTRRKSRALVYYLAAHTQPLTRDHLLAFFWPDTRRASAQQTLRTTLHGLRKALGSALVVEEDSISLSAETRVDAREFERALADLSSSRLTSVLDLYTGDFLADVSLPDTPAFDDWVTVQREHYCRLAVRGLTALSRLHEAAQDYAGALASLDRALAFDPLQEDLQREAMRLLYLAGDRPAAVRRYDQLRKLLDDELGMPPMAETRKLYDEILADTLSATKGQRPKTESRVSFGHPTPDLRSPAFAPDFRPLAPESLPFAGRSAEMQLLRDWSARAERPLMLIEGEPGIGKTRLAEEFLRDEKSLALVGAARELEQALPYQPIIEALRGLVARADWPALRASLQASLAAVWLAEVARLLPELDMRAATTADESRLWEGLHQFLRALARQRPIVVFLDDLHWADASTLALLGYLARLTATAPIALVATSRPVAARSTLGALLQSLTREGRLERLALARLSANEVSTLAQHLSAAYAHPLADWLMRQSEGNPYMLIELIRHARQTNLLNSGGVLNLTRLASAPVVPQTVYSLIQSRLAKLSDEARRVLDVAVAVGREFDFDVVVRAAGLSESAALDALDELRADGLIQPSAGARYAFDHTLTMEVAYRETGELRHRLLHRRVAEALEVNYRERLDSGMAGLVAWHFIEGNAPERAAPYAFRAGEQAARLAAWREAIAFFEQALGVSDKSTRYKVLMALGEAYTMAGEDARASEVFREALALAQARGDADQIEGTQMALARSFLPQARFAEAIALAQQVSASTNPRNRLDAESTWGTALSIEGADLAGAAERLRRAESLCERADAARLAHVKFELGNVAAQQGELEQAIALYREALEVASSTDAQDALYWRILAHNNLAYHLHLVGDASAEGYARVGLALAQEKGVLIAQVYLMSTLGEIALAASNLDAADKYSTEGLALAERLAIPERVAGLTANLGRVAAQRGETTLAIHRLSTALARADMLGTQHLAAQIRLWLAPLLPPSEARARLAEARAIAERGNRRRLLEDIARASQAMGE